MPLITTDAPHQSPIQRHVVMEFRVAVDTAESKDIPAQPHNSLINPNPIRIPGQDDIVDVSTFPHIRNAWLSSLEAALNRPTNARYTAGESVEEIVRTVATKLQSAVQIGNLMERVQSMKFPVPEVYRIDLPFPRTSLGLRQEIIERLIPFVGVRDMLQRFEDTLDLPIRTLTLRHYDPETPIMTGMQ